jgi:uncharacterized protein DUF2752
VRDAAGGRDAATAPGAAGVLDPAARVRRLGMAIACGLLPAVAACLPPLHPLPIDLCLLHRLTGFPCLGCGMTRAICLLAHGRLRDSLAMHPAGILAAAAIVVGGALSAVESAVGRLVRIRPRPPRPRRGRPPRLLPRPFDRSGRP